MLALRLLQRAGNDFNSNGMDDVLDRYRQYLRRRGMHDTESESGQDADGPKAQPTYQDITSDQLSSKGSLTCR